MTSVRHNMIEESIGCASAMGKYSRLILLCNFKTKITKFIAFQRMVCSWTFRRRSAKIAKLGT